MDSFGARKQGRKLQKKGQKFYGEDKCMGKLVCLNHRGSEHIYNVLFRTLAKDLIKIYSSAFERFLQGIGTLGLEIFLKHQLGFSFS